MSYFQRATRKVKKTVKKGASATLRAASVPVDLARKEIKKIDPTSSQTKIGQKIGAKGRDFVRAGAASAAIGLTGGAVLIARPDLKDDVVRGYQVGAAVGGAIAAGGGIVAAAKPVTASITGSPPATQAAPKGAGPVPSQGGMLSKLIRFAFPRG